MRDFVYYYFLGRKRGLIPCMAAKYAKAWSRWWDAKEYAVDVGPAPLIQQFVRVS